MKFKKADITTVQSGIVCHGVNCQGVMGSGVAKAIKNKWPSIYKSFQQQGKGKHLLGTTHIICVQDDPELFVANCYTQEYYGKDGRAYASLEAIESALRPVFLWASTLGLTIHSPMIGCGLGGLHWYTRDDKSVSAIYERLIEEFDHPDIFIYQWNQ